jgi:hypothetical protein
MDEFGNESQLYQDTLFHVSTLVDKIPLTPPIKHYLDKGDIMDTSVSEVALGLWAYSYSKHFRDKYNITKSNLEEVSVDDIIRHIEEYYPKPVTATPTVVQQEVKEGVEDLFNSNPELAAIGTQEQYSQYLDTIFPDSKVKDIVYHDSNVDLKVTGYDKDKIGQNDGTVSGNGIGFYSKEDKWLGKRYNTDRQYDNPSIVNLSNPIIKKDFLKLHNTNTLEEAVQKATGATLKNISKHNKTVIDVATPLQEKLNVDGVINQFLEGKEYLVFEPKQIHILGSNNDIQGFKEFVSSNVIPEQRLTDEMLNSIESINATENTIRDLAARMADRIGMPVRFESDRTKDYKGKIENNTAVINLANATLDTPIHEILGHPIIRTIKQSTNYSKAIFKVKKGKEDYLVEISEKDGWRSQRLKNLEKRFTTREEAEDYKNQLQQSDNQLYQNLLKELETGRGKEVLDRIKKDYEYKKIGIQNELIVKKEIRLSNNVEKDFYKIVDKNNQFLYIPDLPSEFYNSEKEAYDVIKTLSSKIPYYIRRTTRRSYCRITRIIYS